MKTLVKFLLFVVVIAFGEGCHHGKNAQGGGGDEFARKKRSLANAPDARKDLSDFFTECMIRKNKPGIIPVMRSVVDFALRDTIWYEASDTYFCKGHQDTFGCWQGIVDLLIDWDSKMLGPCRECILEYSTKSRTGGYKQKRAISDSEFNGLGPDPPCPQVSDNVYGSCVTVEVNETMSAYPSLAHFHWESIAIFIREHLSRCRIEEFVETWSGKTAYRRKCAHSRFKGTDGEQVKYATEQCVPFLLLEVIKEESPLRPGVKICNEIFSNYKDVEDSETGYVSDPGDVLIEDFTDPDQEFAEHGHKGMHAGADIIGYCDPKSTFTRWFDNDRNNQTGDRELLQELREAFPGEICARPQGIQIRVARNEQPYYTSGNHLKAMSPGTGLECVNTMQHGGRNCENFKVRFCCLGDDDGDQEHIHPFKRTADTLGVCEGRDKWGPWKNIDSNRGDGGDHEYFKHYGQNGCQPVAVQGRIARTNTPYTHSRNNFRTEDPNIGIVCSDEFQPKERPCRDFEVRFCCKDGRGATTNIETATPSQRQPKVVIR